jgi:hypothetical protein
LHEPETWTIAGTSSSTIFSKNGYQDRSVSGWAVQCPPDGSGFRLQPTKPNSFTHRSSSAMELATGTPGDCGSWQTPAKVSGNSPHALIRSLQRRVQAWLTASLPTWWAMVEARGEKMVKSAPRSLISRNWFCSIVSRISSSEIAG